MLPGTVRAPPVGRLHACMLCPYHSHSTRNNNQCGGQMGGVREIGGARKVSIVIVLEPDVLHCFFFSWLKHDIITHL
jgi:hypothetical protein